MKNSLCWPMVVSLAASVAAEAADKAFSKKKAIISYDP